MLIGGPAWGSFALQFALVSFVFEAISRRIPRQLLVLPIALFLVHFSYVFVQNSVIAEFENRIQSSNSQNTFQFDPGEHSLVTDSENFVKWYNVPIAFTELAAQTDFSYRNLQAHVLANKKQCNIIPRDSESRLTKNTSGLSYGCRLDLPTVPTKQIIRLEQMRRNEIFRGFSFKVTTYVVHKKNKKIAEYRTASIRKLRHYPFFMLGCGLNDMPSAWLCTARFHSKKYTLQTNPFDFVGPSATDPVELLLGIKKRTSITQDDEQAAERIIKTAKNFDNSQVQYSFSFLKLQLHHPHIKAPKRLLHYLTLQQDQLLLHQDLLLQSFSKNAAKDSNKNPEIQEVTKVVSIALTELPNEILKQHRKHLLKIMTERDNLNRFSGLFLRLKEFDTLY